MALNGGPDALNGSHKICESHNCTPKNFRGFAATSQQNWCGGTFKFISKADILFAMSIGSSFTTVA